MLSNKFFPYSSMQEINLDWILTKVKNLMRFLPDDGSVGQILRRTAHGAEWSNEQGGGGAVTSVNGQTGDVVLAIPDSTSDLINDSGFVDAAGAAAAAPVQKVNGQTGTVTINKTSVGLGNVANVLQYSASNPPPYPVTSVNTQTGDVVLSIPTDTADLTNTAGYVNAAGAAAAAPVQSVNGYTGAVSLTAADVGAAQANTSGNGYCKMPDGTLLCWGDFTTNRSQYSMSGFGSMYAADVDLNLAFAQTFIAEPSISVVCTNNGCPIMWARANASSLVHMQAMRHVNNGPPDGSTWRYIAIGRWTN